MHAAATATGEVETHTGHLILGERPGYDRFMGEAGAAFLYVSGAT
jgi:hypothetical protein